MDAKLFVVNRLNIIYIIGAGRSGTTLLDIILGNQHEIFSAGELNRYLSREGEPHSPRDSDVDTFWSKVKNDIKDSSKGLKEISERLEYHSGWFDRLFIPQRDIERYKDFNQRLFESIDNHSPNQSLIVDSSKFPMRAKLLAETFGNQISFIYVQRNPNDVVSSFGKKDVEQPSKRTISAHLYLFIVNIVARWVLSNLRRSHRMTTISYDQLVSSPIGVISQISIDLMIDLEDVKSKLKNRELLDVGYLFDGNRLRLEKEIQLNLRTGSKNKDRSPMKSILLSLHRLFWFKF